MRNICRTLSLAAMLLLSAIGAYSKVYLVSVGIDDYPGVQNDLSFCVRDSKGITWVYGKNPEGVISRQLTDRQATVGAIINAMEGVFSQAKPSDKVVFFFSGHGYDGGFVAYDGSLSYSKVKSVMRGSKAKTKVIFADACYSGAIRTPKKNPSSTSAKDSGVMLFLSSRTGEMSIDGAFTTTLQSGLRGKADANRDRTITAKELFTYVHNEVVRSTGGQQHPVMWGKFPDNMAVMTW